MPLLPKTAVLTGLRWPAWVQVAALAGVYWAVSQFGLMLAIPPGYSTAVWPASGIAVAAVLIWGYHLVPGAILGSLLTNLGVGLGAKQWDWSALPGEIPVALGIAIGAGVQAWVGALLVRRLLGYPSGFDTGRSVFGLLLLAGPVSVLINASWSNALLIGGGLLDPGQALFSWWTWWVGDCVGVLIFLPLMLLAFGEPREAWAFRRFATGVPLVLGFALACLLFVYSSRVETKRVEEAFDTHVGITAESINRKLQVASNVTQQVAGFVANVPGMRFADFLDHVGPLLHRYPELQHVSWAPVVAVDEVPEFLTRLRALDLPELTLPSTDASRLAPVTFTAPLQSRFRPPGYNLLADPHLAPILQDAARSNVMLMSSPDVHDGRRSLHLVVPVYASDAMLADSPEAHVRGYVLACIDPDLLLPARLGGMQPGDFAMQVVDRNSGRLVASRGDLALLSSVTPSRRTVSVLGRDWVLDMAPSYGFFAAARTLPVWTMMASGMLLAGMLGGFLLVVSGRMFRIEMAVANRTRSLEQEVEIRRQAEEALRVSQDNYRELAYHDSLTGLPNRALFLRRLTTAIHHAGKNGNDLAVHFFDLDHFKDINDALGHPVGDALLVKVAEKLRGMLRKTDTLARLGGDEFAILQAGVLHRNQARELANRTILDLSLPMMVEGYEVRSSTSVGIAYLDGARAAGKTVAELSVRMMEEADIALYAVKERQRGAYRFHEPQMTERAHRTIQLGHALKRALEVDSDELFLAYQPQIDMRTGGIVGFEALARWNSPELGVVNPAEFVAVAEARGLIVSLGRFTLRRACRLLTRGDLAQRLGREFRVAVNISGSQFTELSFVADVKSILQEAGADPQRLELELTEGVLARSIDQVDRAMRQLKAMGISIAIDDFGTGYSSLLYLKRMPVDRIKVAQEFVRDMLHDTADAEIVRATVQIAVAMELDLVVEGVETREHVNHLRSLGCRIGQGYFYQAAVAEEALLSLPLQFHQQAVA